MCNLNGVWVEQKEYSMMRIHQICFCEGIGWTFVNIFEEDVSIIYGICFTKLLTVFDH